MFCLKCGAKIKEGQKFCMVCGAAMATPQTTKNAQKTSEASEQQNPNMSIKPKAEKQKAKVEAKATEKKKGKKGVILLIIIAAILIVAIALIVVKFVWAGKDKQVENKDDGWTVVSEDSQSENPESSENINPSENLDSTENVDESTDTYEKDTESVVIENSHPEDEDINVDNVVQQAKDIYYGINGDIDNYKKVSTEGVCTDYYDKTDNIRKTVMSPDGDAADTVKGYTVEFYYDSDQNTSFIFAYKKVKGKVKEYRAYYGANEKLYRYIDPSGKVKDYKEGKELDDSSELVTQLYNASRSHLSLDYGV